MDIKFIATHAQYVPGISKKFTVPPNTIIIETGFPGQCVLSNILSILWQFLSKDTTLFFTILSGGFTDEFIQSYYEKHLALGNVGVMMPKIYELFRKYLNILKELTIYFPGYCIYDRVLTIGGGRRNNSKSGRLFWEVQAKDWGFRLGFYNVKKGSEPFEPSTRIKELQPDLNEMLVTPTTFFNASATPGVASRTPAGHVVTKFETYRSVIEKIERLYPRSGAIGSRIYVFSSCAKVEPGFDKEALEACPRKAREFISKTLETAKATLLKYIPTESNTRYTVSQGGRRGRRKGKKTRKAAHTRK